MPLHISRKDGMAFCESHFCVGYHQVFSASVLKLLLLSVLPLSEVLAALVQVVSKESIKFKVDQHKLH